MWYIYTVKHYSSVRGAKLCHLRRCGGLIDYHTEWCKSERKNKQTYVNGYVWNLEKMVYMILFARKTRDTDVENEYMDAKGESPGSDGTNWEIGIGICTFDTVYKIDN